MFEDSTFESQGRIRTRSRAWMLAALAFNGSILMALILIPLIYPEALPSVTTILLMETPPPPPSAPPPPPRPIAQRAPVGSDMSLDQLVAPRRIPPQIFIARGPEPPAFSNVAAMDPGDGTPGGTGTDLFHGQPKPVVHFGIKAPMRVSTMVEEGLLIQKTVPVYPPIAIAARMEGTVALAATISKTGTIENLRVVSGPAMLQQAALNAVQRWRYRPYLLNGEPVEVETTVNVVFSMQH